ncbi:transcription termination factor Rho [Olsenella uli]|uniref:transcription termination factor Rho n=1 Tax=Olsenella uli TaxID=133926 RepID=UPI0028E39998|nr:transcription termination factor Rho [Olsenella uli]
MTKDTADPAQEAMALPTGEAEAPKRRRRTARKKAQEEAAAPLSPEPPLASGEVAEKPKPRRRRAKSAAAVEEQVVSGAAQPEATPAIPTSPLSEAPMTPPREIPAASKDGQAGQQSPSEEAAKPKRRRGRPRKSEQLQADAGEAARPSQGVTPSTATVLAAPAATLAEADAAAERLGDQHVGGQGVPASRGADQRSADQHDDEATPRHRRRRERAHSQNGEAADGRGGNGYGGYGSNRPGRNQKRRGRRGQNDANLEPSLTRDALAEMKVAELRVKAQELHVDYVGVRKKALAEAIYQAAARAEGFRSVEGVLEIQNEGYGFLRTGNYMVGEDDAFVHQQLIRQYGLRAGDKVAGSVAPARNGNSKFPPLHKVEAINGAEPEKMRSRPRFRDLTPIYPNERLVMEHGKESVTGRAIDLVAPIGKGQRGLIVSPPKAGKTTVLKHICQSITANNPEVHLFCLLVDERPEEVTDMERSIRGEVVASTFDMPASNHTAVAELVIERAKRLVELGEDVVVVLDSITRLARAYNLAAPASGRILSGGVDSAALYPPKKFLGAARNIEGGGSLTILASALVDTGSKMDEVIFEEFKGTGNMELKLDRDLADRRIFPAIDPVASGTRNEDLLLDTGLQPFVWGIRRVLANMNNTERAASALVKGLRGTKDNEEFLIRSAKKAQQSDYFQG